MALVLLPAPIAFIIFMGDQQRFFGRWLLPVFPIAALLAAYAAVELVRAVARFRPPLKRLAAAVVAVALLVPSLVSVIHDDQVLSRPDTRNLARAWMVRHVSAGSRVVLEPFVPDNWALDVGSSLPVTPTGERWWRYPTWLSNIDNNGRPLPNGRVRYVVVDQYERTLRPELLDGYVQQGYCWLMTGSLQAGRAFAQARLVPGAIAYYAALRKRATLAYEVSPFAPGTRPAPFSFDFSIDYYPGAYRLPGPRISVFRLHGGSCS
jgi:hypothetical protein